MQPTLGNESALALMQPKIGDDHLLKKFAKAVAEFMHSLPRMLSFTQFMEFEANFATI